MTAGIGTNTGGGVVAGEAYVVVGANLGPLVQGLRGVQSTLQNTADKIKGLGFSLAKVGAGITAPFAGAVAAASSYEDALTELVKVTDRATADKLSSSLREIAKESATSANSLTLLAADAARFGVQGSDNILKFVQTVNKLAIATDLSTEQAGTAFAKLQGLLGFTIDEIENVGSSINTLGQNFATSESEIVDALLRASSAAKSLGLNRKEILGLSAVFNEFSVSSQVAGTSLRSLSASLLNPKKVEAIANALGISADSFKRLRDESPLEAIKLLAQTLNAGGEQAEILGGSLDELAANSLRNLGSNLGQVDKAVSLANSSFEEGTSLQKEYETASKTFSNLVQRLGNNLNDLAIVVGNQVLPYVSAFIESIISAINPISAFIKQNASLVVGVAAVGAALLAAGTSLIGLGAAMQVLSVAVGGLVAGLGLVAGIVGAVGAPIAGVIAVVLALGVAFVTLTDTGKSAVSGLVSVLGTLITSFAKTLAEMAGLIAKGDISGAFETLTESIKGLWDDAIAYINGLWQELAFGVTQVANTIQLAWIDALDSIKTISDTVFNNLLESYLRIKGLITGGDVSSEIFELKVKAAESRQAREVLRLNLKDQLEKDLDAYREELNQRIAPTSSREAKDEIAKATTALAKSEGSVDSESALNKSAKSVASVLDGLADSLKGGAEKVSNIQVPTIAQFGGQGFEEAFAGVFTSKIRIEKYCPRARNKRESLKQ